MKNILDLTAIELGRRIKKREIGPGSDGGPGANAELLCNHQ